MKKKQHVKMVHEGNYVAEVKVDLLYTGEGWSPYLSLEDAQKLDTVRESLRSGDISTARKFSRVYRLTPV